MQTIIQNLDEKGLMLLGDNKLSNTYEYHDVFKDFLKAIGRATQNSIRITWNFGKRIVVSIFRAIRDSGDVYNQTWARHEMMSPYTNFHHIR